MNPKVKKFLKGFAWGFGIGKITKPFVYCRKCEKQFFISVPDADVPPVFVIRCQFCKEYGRYTVDDVRFREF